MKVFIDTNIFLDLYHLSGPDLEELRKLKKIVEKNKVELLVSQQVIDEFWRNRERIIADALKKFTESKANAKIPNIIRIYEESKALKAAVDDVNQRVKQLTDRVNSDIATDHLKADEVIKELFDAVTVGEISEETFSRAKRRRDLGNPPGKGGSLGDALNWEWLLEREIDFWDDELVIVSADGDFESELTKGQPREYLLREWADKNTGCPLVLETSLTGFLQKYFPDIQLAEEFDKIEEIERLERSRTFMATHNAIAALNKYDDFKDTEVQRLLNAFLENNQVLWILGDPDVRMFATKIIGLAKSPESGELVDRLQIHLDDLDPSADDDEIPF